MDDRTSERSGDAHSRGWVMPLTESDSGPMCKVCCEVCHAMRMGGTGGTTRRPLWLCPVNIAFEKHQLMKGHTGAP